ncbi:MAG: hypothetical protein LBV74_16135 [Tannerella sp.]|jgi:hypothetical protein|nr:hypothetical protein [Tannerella sp.]
MKYILSFILSLLAISAIHAQHMPADILAKADSIMIAAVGRRIFDTYYVRTETNCYDYKLKKKSKTTKSEFLSQYGKGISNKPTKGHFAGAGVTYEFRLNEKQFWAPYTREYIAFDSVFNLSTPLDLAYIPQYAWDNDTCNFITSLQAVALAVPHFSNPAVAYDTAEIAFETYKSGIRVYRYCWTVSRITWQERNENGQPFGDREMVVIDALTGEVLTTQREEFGSAPIME